MDDDKVELLGNVHSFDDALKKIGMSKEEFDKYDLFLKNKNITNRVLELMKLEHPVAG